MECVGVSIKYVIFEQYELVENNKTVNKQKKLTSFFNKISSLPKNHTLNNIITF